MANRQGRGSAEPAELSERKARHVDLAPIRGPHQGQQSIREIKTKTKGFLLMVTEDGTKVLPEIIDALRNSGIEITTINLKKPTMDDVFVFYTGKELRDEGAAPAKQGFLRAGGR